MAQVSTQFITKMTPLEEFHAANWPMVPYDGIAGLTEIDDFSHEVQVWDDNVPCEHCDFRPYVNSESTDITDEDIQMNINGADNMAWLTSEEHQLYKELESNKELLDRITYEIRENNGDGEFKYNDIVATQQTIHQNLALNKQHPGYAWIDVSGLPSSYFNCELKLGGVDRGYFEYLRKHCHVWYVCHQKEHNRIVIMGGNYANVQKCIELLRNKLYSVSSGGHIQPDMYTTVRYSKAVVAYNYDIQYSSELAHEEGMNENDFCEMVQKTLDDETKIFKHVSNSKNYI
jgi:hypothetical protein